MTRTPTSSLPNPQLTEIAALMKCGHRLTRAERAVSLIEQQNTFDSTALLKDGPGRAVLLGMLKKSEC